MAEVPSAAVEVFSNAVLPRGEGQHEAQNINVVALYPWLMLSVVPVFIVVLAFNFFGDGLRDAADPYSAVARN